MDGRSDERCKIRLDEGAVLLRDAEIGAQPSTNDTPRMSRGMDNALNAGIDVVASPRVTAPRFDRIATHHERSVAPHALREERMEKDLKDQLTKYLTDAHSIEEQSLAQLRKAPEIAGEPALAQALREHLAPTERHERRIRDLLEARGESPSGTKDLIMRLGGVGFILFARSQPDTPGKLAAHALSYEALEWAAYDLLARTADRAGEQAIADVARSIRDEERAMMDRIESLFDRTADASLANDDDDSLRERLRKYLADAHAIEGQSISLLESAQDVSEQYPALVSLFASHLSESERQRRLIEDRLHALGGDESALKDAALRIAAVEWSTFFRAHPDTPGKIMAFAYALEHLEIGGYEQLRRVATRANDPETVAVVDEILAEERAAAARLADSFEEAVSAALIEQGITR